MGDSDLDLSGFSLEGALEALRQNSSWGCVELPYPMLLGDEASQEYLTCILRQPCEVDRLVFGETELEDGFLADEELVGAAVDAQVRQLAIPYDFPPALLTCFRANSSLECVEVNFCFDVKELVNPRKLSKACALLRSCRNAPFDVSAVFFEMTHWNPVVWSALADELTKVDSFTALEFMGEPQPPLCFDGEVCEEAMKTLFPRNNRRRLKLLDYQGIEISESVMDIIPSSVHDLEIDPEFGFHQRLYPRLAKETAVVEILYLNRLEDPETIEAFIASVPHFTSVKDLTARFSDVDEDGKRKILRAIWGNRSLTDGIEIDITGRNASAIDDADRVYLQRIRLRNLHLPGMIDPSVAIDRAMMPYLLDLSSPDERFTTLRSSVADLVPKMCPWEELGKQLEESKAAREAIVLARGALDEKLPGLQRQVRDLDDKSAETKKLIKVAKGDPEHTKILQQMLAGLQHKAVGLNLQVARTKAWVETKNQELEDQNSYIDKLEVNLQKLLAELQ